MYIDSHCHLDFPALRESLAEMLEAATAASIAAIIIPGVCPVQWHEAEHLIATHNRQTTPLTLYGAAGLHPWWIEDYQLKGETETPLIDRFERELRDRIEAARPIAIGECGLDGAINTELPLQQRLFECQLRLAEEFQLPLIVHVRRSHNEALRCLDKAGGHLRGVIHGFSGSEQQAREYWRRGFSLGVGGSITYERAKKTRRAFTQLPLEALLLETDAPDMPLSGCQGEVNTPLQLLEVAAVLAELRGLPLADVARQTTLNAQRLFALAD